MKDLKNIQQGELAQFLIHEHSFGTLRDEADLNNAKFHTTQSITLVLDFIKNIVGSNEDKIEYLEKELNEIEKFHGKKR